MKTWTFEIEGDVAGSNQGRDVRYQGAKPRHYNSRDYETWKSAVGMKAKAAGVSFHPDREWTVDYIYWRSGLNGPKDADAPQKPLLDALQLIAYRTDRQVIGGSFVAHPDPARPRIEVTLTLLDTSYPRKATKLTGVVLRRAKRVE